MTNTTIPKHGPGAAHIGYSMFGARGPLLNLVGDGNGAAAPPAQTPVVAPTTTQGDPVTAPGAAASEKMLPQSQVNALIAEAKRDTEAKTRARVAQEAEAARAAAAAPAPKAASAAPTPPGTGISADEVQLMIARARAFERVTATAGLSDRQMSRMEEALASAKPTDVTEWSRSWLEDMGIKPAAAPPAPPAAATTTPTVPTTSAAATTTAAPAPPAAAPAAPSTPVSPTTSNGLVDLFRLTGEQLDALGPAGVKEHFNRALAVGQQQAGVLPRPKLPPR